jgi:hypothetical protein
MIMSTRALEQAPSLKLKHIRVHMPIATTPEKLWDVLSHFGDVSSFHAGVVESHRQTGSEDRAAMGCERVCHIVDMGLAITLNERIVDYVEGQSYAFETYEWKNFPIRRMRFGFTILPGDTHHTTLAIDIHYRAKPAFLTPLMAAKMRRLARDVSLGYKHHAETGEMRVPITQLRRRYKAFLRLQAQPA